MSGTEMVVNMLMCLPSSGKWLASAIISTPTLADDGIATMGSRLGVNGFA